ncbi:hypothetical protein P3X46_024070 [Hevea brasiliensis]|uniref:Uncharacterized protein n=1 Tax=Hevea brasiliensis TaxID=3981 RepID=A0ABQ9LGE6_HEVBR|nr:hypothetical protein P3X46_024070 [Hevea brasiliensis]
MNRLCRGSAILILCFFSISLFLPVRDEGQNDTFICSHGTYWDRTKTVIHRAKAYFFSPNTGYIYSLAKVDPAKSAAKIASETVHNAKEKVKRSPSYKGRQESDHSKLGSLSMTRSKQRKQIQSKEFLRLSIGGEKCNQTILSSVVDKRS